jgi:hypothetical protein
MPKSNGAQASYGAFRQWIAVYIGFRWCLTSLRRDSECGERAKQCKTDGNQG